MVTAVQTCYRHPDRRAGVVCQRCDRPICPDCMHEASVGFHCPECARTGAQRVIRPSDLGPGRPVVALAIVAVNLAIFVFGIGPGLVTRTEVTDAGGLATVFFDGTALRGVTEGEWWRIVTSGFLHANVMHVAFNCFLAWQLGMLLEPVLGRLRFGLLYAAGLVSGSLGALLLSEPGQITVGASGAVFGLMGAAVVAMRSRGVDPFQTGVGGLLVLNLGITFIIPGISVGGHLGGLAGGLLAGALIEQVGPRLGRGPVPATALVAVQVAAGFVGCLLVAASV